MEDYYYINTRGIIIQLHITHPIFYIENSLINRFLERSSFSKKQPFYIDIDPNSFHTILTYLNCHQETISGDDMQAQKYLKLLENQIETNPILLYSMNKLAILDDITHKTQWSCSLDKIVDITEKWDNITGFVYIVNMLCENKYKKKYFCINKFGTYKKNSPIILLEQLKTDFKNSTSVAIELLRKQDYKIFWIDGQINLSQNIFYKLLKLLKSMLFGRIITLCSGSEIPETNHSLLIAIPKRLL